MLSSVFSCGLLATALLIRGVLAGRYDARKRAFVIEDVVITEAITVIEEPNGTFVTEAPVIIGTTTIDGTPVVVSSTVAPSEFSSALIREVSLSSPSPESPASTPEHSSSASTSSAIAGLVPTTLSTVHIVLPTIPALSIPIESTTFSTSTTNSAASTVSSTSFITPSSTSSSTSSSGKRGLAYNTISLLADFIGSGSQSGWCYNWGSTPGGTVPKPLEYVPMLWGLDSSATDAWDSAVSTALASGSSHLLAFNEPDLDSQSNIGYQDAANGYMEYMQPYAGKAKLGAPAVTNGDAASGMGLGYLSSFLNSCSSCTIDFVPIHWYDSATNIQYFKDHVTQAYAAGGNRPIWITEFGATGSAAQQQTFLETVIPWLDAQDFVERYAYFMVADGSMVTGTSINALGQTFAFSA